MKSKIYSLILTLMVMIFAGPPVAMAKQITPEEARLVAYNQIQLVSVRDGAWGEQKSAQLGPMQALQENGRLLGYLFQIEPVGYIIVSPYRELAPVRAYSVHSNIDPAENGPLFQAFKTYQGIVHDGIADKLGRQPAIAEDFSNVIPVNFDDAWIALLDPAFNPAPLQRAGTRSIDMIYQEGEQLLITTWNQSPPYNDMCPDHNCTWEFCEDYNSNTWAGCVATAGAQVLKYWDWPPTGAGGGGYDVTYDWPNMGNRYTYSISYHDWWVEIPGGGMWATQAQIDAVALLQRKVGVGVNMDYGCSSSSAYTYDLESAFQNHFRIISNMGQSERDDYTYTEWVNRLVDEFNHNRPVVYRIDGHAVVADGWEEDLGVYLFHIVYGHNGSNDGWWSTGEIPGGGPTDEHYIMENIRPDFSIGAGPLGPIALPSYPYRYFDRNVSTFDCQFAAGHNLQILGPGFYIEAEEMDPMFSVSFEGTPGLETNLFFDGNPDETTCIKINDGKIKMVMGGMMVFH
jgi:Peptidase C10 family